MQHPIENLSLHGGTIYGPEGGPEPDEYMAPITVNVVKKLSFLELKGGKTYRYIFELSPMTNAVWHSIFKDHLSDFPVEFEGKRMTLDCIPVNLEGRYCKIRDALPKVNAAYMKAREELISLIAAQDAEREAAEKAEKSRVAAVKKQFDDLQI